MEAVRWLRRLPGSRRRSFGVPPEEVRQAPELGFGRRERLRNLTLRLKEPHLTCTHARKATTSAQTPVCIVTQNFNSIHRNQVKIMLLRGAAELRLFYSNVLQTALALTQITKVRKTYCQIENCVLNQLRAEEL